MTSAGTTTYGNAAISGNATVGGKGVAVGEENLRIVRGTWGFDAGGIVYTRGSGWTWSNPSVGHLTITFNPPFSSPPTVTATQISHRTDSDYGFIMIPSTTANSFTIETRTGSANFGNYGFNFIAIGPR